MMALLIYVRDQMWPTMEPTALCQEGLSSRRGGLREWAEPYRNPSQPGSSHPLMLCVCGGGVPEDPSAHQLPLTRGRYR